jgi:hypothetical protein
VTLLLKHSTTTAPFLFPGKFEIGIGIGIGKRLDWKGESGMTHPSTRALADFFFLVKEVSRFPFQRKSFPRIFLTGMLVSIDFSSPCSVLW